MENPKISIENLTHVYVTNKEANVAIENIQLAIQRGEFISLVGPSGCGKSTILSCIAGLLQPTCGSISIDNQLITKPSATVGYMLQSDYLFEWKSILKNACVGLEVMGQLTKDSIEHAKYLLDELGLGKYQHHYPSQLSGGMRQRAALVRTLVSSPEVLLLDEPFSALDYQNKLKLEDLVFDTLKKQNKTAILVTHDIAEAIAMSDKIAILDNNPGRIKEIIEIPEHIRETKPFLAREVDGFYEIFHKIWKELDQDE
ncbi:spermidine/putrescine ABC transporter ATP-binding protein [Desulfuribacillus stibiiarsenatis]|uniref:Spermidine/putrescine ABC transporter ATP-binding protein n=1 Tax=Desulfuribacillus stibiiarsenatis TaxID=1390249 RepID=A0A1E5L456_9FIRM|nr:ABC transporter ATP-binding protein [Desulfuribacillus stibiiarsenatis]OEH84895.1 spermidine/putrescine ABC transporter ATP-binding protein [Desulfuribacillus stibiiarsenatis]